MERANHLPPLLSSPFYPLFVHEFIRRRGLEARRKFVEPIGAWFTQIGGLHTVFHIWQYPSLEERKKTRDRAWEVDTWSGTVSEVSKVRSKDDGN